jgi:hypothetical protein
MVFTLFLAKNQSNLPVPILRIQNPFRNYCIFINEIKLFLTFFSAIVCGFDCEKYVIKQVGSGRVEMGKADPVWIF